MVGATKGGTHLGVGGEGRGRKRWNDKRPAADHQALPPAFVKAARGAQCIARRLRSHQNRRPQRCAPERRDGWRVGADINWAKKTR
eukprot:scaffold100460_cov27-Tisochrysis_lutea.AAC.2